MTHSLRGAVLSRVATALVFGIVIGILRDFSLGGWLVFVPLMLIVGVFGGLASWYGARLAERRLRSRREQP